MMVIMRLFLPVFVIPSKRIRLAAESHGRHRTAMTVAANWRWRQTSFGAHRSGMADFQIRPEILRLRQSRFGCHTSARFTLSQCNSQR
jgi:hypothetical protein